MSWLDRLPALRGLLAGADEPRAVVTRRFRRQRLLLLDTILIGIAGALATQLFVRLVGLCDTVFMTYLARYHAPALPSEGGALIETIGPFGLWLIPVATTIGGLIVGLLVQDLAPEAGGEGTDTVIRAYHQREGILRGRVAPLKLVASAITIGSGGAAGPEGPVALITATIGSWYGTLTHHDAEERRLLLLIGMAAGLSAIFRSPIGTAIMAVEVLYADMEFERDALLYTMIGAIVAYAVNGIFVGWQPLLRMPATLEPLRSAADYGRFIALGMVAGVVGTLQPVVFYEFRDWFQRLPVRPFLQPAIGGLLTGLLALAYPQVLGEGYGWMQRAVDGHLVFGVLAALVIAKILAMSFSVASGGSGGVFAPSLFIGAMLGGAFAAALHQPAAPYVVVGMATVLAGSAHLPIATLIMVSEITGGYALLVPTALAVTISYLVQSQLSARLKYPSIYEAQVPNRAESPAHRAQQVQAALRVLHHAALPDLSQIGELDLFSLLRSSIPVELPGGRRLVAGTLRADSPFVGCTVRSTTARFGTRATNVIAIVRGDTFVVPAPGTVLESGDRLLIVAGLDDVEEVRRHLAGW